MTATLEKLNGIDTLSVRAARMGFAGMLGRANHAKSPTIIISRGKPVAALVPIEDLELIEDEIDRRFAALAKVRLEEIRSGKEKTIPHADVQKEIERIRKAKTKVKTKVSA
jgi:prevent-host-death family protein